ncbi:putative cell wall-binding protein [Salinibacterium sp. CAN_S4]|uniref:cell wall-binding repeat-containing protein n=1 Tax=Salinibacterium sp. CAN_S4 TaxID=2787727 RepID=UPI0018EFC3B5
MLATRYSRQRSRIVAAAATIAICGALAISPVMAAAADEPIDTSSIEVMGTFPAADFVAEAQDLPPELVASLDTDLGITGEEFIAQAEAAVQAVDVVDSLESAGVDVLGSRIDGTTLTVNVASDGDVAVVEAVGAVPVIGEPTAYVAPDAPLKFMADPKSTFYGGQGYYVEIGGNAFRCTSGFNGFSSSGVQQFVSAGHCLVGAQGQVRALTMSRPNEDNAQLGSALGTAVPGSAALGGGYDSGLVNVTNASVSTKASLQTWGNGAGAPLSSTPLGITGKSETLTGAPVCKSGSSTGWACGRVLAVDALVTIEGEATNSIVTTACTIEGDSGGPLVSGNLAVGVTSWATTDVPCGNRDFASGSFPMVSGGGFEDVTSLYGSNWQLAITVPAPAVTSSGVPQPGGSPITGSLSGAEAGSTVGLYLDGSPAPIATSAVSSGSWSISMASVPLGNHIYRVNASTGFSKSSSVIVGLNLARISGSDRFAVGVEISKRLYPDPAAAEVVYVTTGLNFPDALSAAPAAAIQRGVMLLTLPTSIPTSVRNEIVRLHPKRIVVVGGVNSVSQAVYNELATLTARDPETNEPLIERQGGTDRYDASRNIVRTAFTGLASASTVYISTGANFPDALSASAAGGAKGYPVILVDGRAGNLDASTRQLLADLGVTSIRIAGGPNSVSTGIQADLTAITRDTVRLSGATRFDASSNIAVDAFGGSNPQDVFLATGLNFPDALSSAVLAGQVSAPLIVVPTDCVPTATLNAIRNFGAENITLVGGPLSLTANVLNLEEC